MFVLLRGFEYERSALYFGSAFNCLELLRRRETLECATDEAERVMYGALRRGLNFKVTMGNLLTLTPALTISRSELDQAVSILDECIGEVEGARKA